MAVGEAGIAGLRLYLASCIFLFFVVHLLSLKFLNLPLQALAFRLPWHLWANWGNPHLSNIWKIKGPGLKHIAVPSSPHGIEFPVSSKPGARALDVGDEALQTLGVAFLGVSLAFPSTRFPSPAPNSATASEGSSECRLASGYKVGGQLPHIPLSSRGAPGAQVLGDGGRVGWEVGHYLVPPRYYVDSEWAVPRSWLFLLTPSTALPL